jgi:hypothetical protein
LKKYIFFSSIFILLFSACSTKEVFEPKKVDSDWEKYENFDDTIIDTSSNVALLEDGKVLTKTELLDIKIDESQRLISKSDGWIISSSIDGNLTLRSIKDKTLKKSFELKKTIASASVKGDTLAVLFANNEMALYDIPSKSITFKEQGSKVLALDARIVNPYFMNDLVLFSTLDGKVVIVNSKLKKRLRTIIVSSEDEFNNIIYFDIVDNKIIAVTAYDILSMSQKEIRAKYEIRNVVYDDKNIYITTKQGEVISLTSSLEVNAKVKFPFAHFLGMISSDDKLYVLEKEGYLIVFDKKSFDYAIYEVDLDDGFVFVADKMFYVANEKILVK